MKRAILIVVGVGALIGAVCFFVRSRQVIYALGSRKVEFTLAIVDQETSRPVPAVTIEIWDNPFQISERKGIAQLVTDDSGIAKYVRDDMSVEDVCGISASTKLEGVLQHPEGVGTFVDRYWCTLDIVARGYEPLRYESLGNYTYEDNGFAEKDNLHRFKFTIPLRKRN